MINRISNYEKKKEEKETELTSLANGYRKRVDTASKTKLTLVAFIGSTCVT